MTDLLEKYQAQNRGDEGAVWHQKHAYYEAVLNKLFMRYEELTHGMVEKKNQKAL